MVFIIWIYSSYKLIKINLVDPIVGMNIIIQDHSLKKIDKFKRRLEKDLVKAKKSKGVRRVNEVLQVRKLFANLVVNISDNKESSWRKDLAVIEKLQISTNFLQF